MSSFNASSSAKGQQWRSSDLLMKASDPAQKTTNEVLKELQHVKYPGHPGHPRYPVHPGHPRYPGHPGHPGHPGLQGHPRQQGNQGHQGHATHPTPPGHLAQPGRPSHAAHSGHGHAGHLGHANHPGQAGQRGQQMLSNVSVCCEQPDCKQAKIEQMPEHYLQKPATPFTLMDTTQGRNLQSGKKEPSGTLSDHNYVYCQGGRGGQLVTICCTGRNCDNATKIDEGIHMGPSDVQMGNPEVFMCSPDVRMGSPDNKGPEEKRARTSYNQYKY